MVPNCAKTGPKQPVTLSMLTDASPTIASLRAPAANKRQSGEERR